MLKYIVLLTAFLTLAAGVAAAQEVTVTGFPVGIAGSVGSDFFQPHHDALKGIADSLARDPLAIAIITGGADGEHYRKHHDAMNPGLALGRAHALRNYLIDALNVNAYQLIVQSEDVKTKGAGYRYASVRITRPASELTSRVAALEQRPPVEKHFIETVTPAPPPSLDENLGLQFGLGVSSSPYGAIPTASAAVAWQRVLFAEVLVGHTFWNNDFHFIDTDLNTKRRLIGGYLVVSPRSETRIGIVGGWLRVEEISQEYYEYVRLSEGPLVGLRVMPTPYLSVTGAYNPVKQRRADAETSQSKSDNFLIAIATHVAFGGAK